MIPIREWRITGLVALLLASVILASWLTSGFTEESVRIVIRATARSSIVLFLMAFTAASLRVLLPSPTTAWLVRNRRYLGVSFALSHFTHLAALVVLATQFPHPFLDDLKSITLVGGGLAYALLTLMTITSFDGPRRLVGERAWKILHTSGSWYLWLIFVNSYVSRTLHMPAYAIFSVALVAAALLRIASWKRRRAALATQTA
ncbi:MAG TPA: hypothetical protein VKB34_10755 [Povalibacter sp.]|nr:hypothetical protein [Povalibacter sp.]